MLKICFIELIEEIPIEAWEELISYKRSWSIHCLFTYYATLYIDNEFEVAGIRRTVCERAQYYFMQKYAKRYKIDMNKVNDLISDLKTVVERIK